MKKTEKVTFIKYISSTGKLKNNSTNSRNLKTSDHEF